MSKHVNLASALCPSSGRPLWEPPIYRPQTSIVKNPEAASKLTDLIHERWEEFKYDSGHLKIPKTPAPGTQISDVLKPLQPSEWHVCLLTRQKR